MINGSFVFGMDGDDPTVFDRTVEWAIGQGIETATFHILTPYPGTALYKRMAARRPPHRNQLGPVRHAPHGVPPGADDGPSSWSTATGARIAQFYTWRNIARGAAAHGSVMRRACGTSPTRRAGRSSSRCGTW